MSNSISILVHPSAKQNKVESKADGSFSIWVTAKPEHNKANEACVRLLAKHLQIAPSRVEITRGLTSRRKTVRIHGSV